MVVVTGAVINIQVGTGAGVGVDAGKGVGVGVAEAAVGMSSSYRRRKEGAKGNPGEPGQGKTWKRTPRQRG